MVRDSTTSGFDWRILVRWIRDMAACGTAVSEGECVRALSNSWRLYMPKKTIGTGRGYLINFNKTNSPQVKCKLNNKLNA